MRNNLKRILSLLLAVLITISIIGCSPKQTEISGNTITITDTVGRKVQVPENPESISCICPFSGAFVVMFGYGEQMTSVSNNTFRSNLLLTFCPTLQNSKVVKNSGSVNAEELLNLKTELIIVNEGTYLDNDEKAKLDSLNIPYIVIGFENISEQMEAIQILGDALNQSEKAKAYIQWYQSVIDNVNEVMETYEGVPIDLYHAVNEATRTDYAGSICSEWIGLCKVNNVSLNTELTMEGDKAYTTLEQIYQWNPEIIICNEPGVDDYILSDEKWAGLECVREGKVYQIPVGISRMGHPTSIETPLSLIWLSELIYPDMFEYDVKEELYQFYKTFFNYELDSETIDAIIQGDEMRKPKEGQ